MDDIPLELLTHDYPHTILKKPTSKDLL
jgi:hypothetical protein